LAIIPARKGSKGIKKKNLIKINNKTLVAHSINYCLRNKNLLDKIVVSSDDNQVLNETEINDLVVPQKRSKKLSQDSSKIIDVIKDITSSKDFSSFDIVVIIEPTCPFRKTKYLKTVLDSIINSKKDFVFTVSKIDKKFHPDKQFVIKNNVKQLYSSKGKKISNRQELNSTFIKNGAIYAIKKNKLHNVKNFFDLNYNFIVTKEDMVNIDTIEDLKYIQNIMNVKISIPK
tara:strand:- start:9409 stop:10098 length:690 start_codon:yes stop_codon:yes gene_type:complete